jgi:hypothetical protein
MTHKLARDMMIEAEAEAGQRVNQRMAEAGALREQGCSRPIA